MSSAAFFGHVSAPRRFALRILRGEGDSATVLLSARPDEAPFLDSFETLATHLRREHLRDVAPEHIRFVAHVPTFGSWPASWDEVKLQWDVLQNRYTKARWRRLSVNEIRQLGCEPEEWDIVIEALSQRGIAVTHAGSDVIIDGYTMARSELQRLLQQAGGDTTALMTLLAQFQAGQP